VGEIAATALSVFPMRLGLGLVWMLKIEPWAAARDEKPAIENNRRKARANQLPEHKLSVSVSTIPSEVINAL